MVLFFQLKKNKEEERARAKGTNRPGVTSCDTWFILPGGISLAARAGLPGYCPGTSL